MKTITAARLLFAFFIFSFFSCFSSASTITYWVLIDYPLKGRFSSAQAACNAMKHIGDINPNAFLTNVTATSAWCNYNSFSVPTTISYGPVYRHDENCLWGDNGSFQCNSECESPNTMVNGQCVSPPPLCESPNYIDGLGNCVSPPSCPSGSTWDPTENRCMFPQDDGCGSVGAVWDPEKNDCSCPAGKTLMNLGGVKSCLTLIEPEADEPECNKNSSDFLGYFGDRPVCKPENKCPSGTKPGFAGLGDEVKQVCAPETGSKDPDCPGYSGLKDGQVVCITPAKPESCSGYYVFDANKNPTCVEPSDGQKCKPDEYSGYMGAGSNREHICVKKNFLPETCPAGQMVITKDGTGWGCASASTTKDSDKSGKGKGSVTGTIGGTGGTGGTGGAGGAGGDAQVDLELDLEGLIDEAPENRYYDDTVKFTDSILSEYGVGDGIQNELAREFTGESGAFTERGKLDQIGDFVLSRTIGVTPGCSGSMEFFDWQISCSRFYNIHRVLSWVLYIFTVLAIYEIVTRPSQSGV